MATRKNKGGAQGMSRRRQGNPIPSTTADPNLSKASPKADPVEADMTTFRASHEGQAVGLDVGGTSVLDTPSMARRPRSSDSSQPRPDGGVGGAVSD